MTNMQLPQYTQKDGKIMAINLPLMTILINCLLLGKRFFSDAKVFVLSGLLVYTIIGISWLLFAWIAITVRNRFPTGKELLKRMIIAISLIVVLQSLVTTLLFKTYDHFHLFGYELNERRFYWTLVICFFINVLITILHEGIESFERWKATLTETEQLKKAYTQSQLLGLRSQVNPHFLFNSLNSLSSLISEDEEKAERFLNEMTKVYRYLLRGNDEQLVTLQTEIKFIQSYYYLLKARYGESIQLHIQISDSEQEKCVTPLLLQTLFEYSFNTNTLSKEKPLCFVIDIDENGFLRMTNNLQLKQNILPANTEAICNLLEKYKLLSGGEIEIDGNELQTVMRVPLLNGFSTQAV
jgi:two-component system LytT family sensor kinase